MKLSDRGQRHETPHRARTLRRGTARSARPALREGGTPCWAPWTSAQTPGPATLPSPATGHPALRETRAFLRDVHRPRIDREQVAADWTLMYHWLRHDHDMVAAGAASQRRTSVPRPRRPRIVELQREVGVEGRTFQVLPNELAFWVRYAWTKRRPVLRSATRFAARHHPASPRRRRRRADAAGRGRARGHRHGRTRCRRRRW